MLPLVKRKFSFAPSCFCWHSDKGGRAFILTGTHGLSFGARHLLLAPCLVALLYGILWKQICPASLSISEWHQKTSQRLVTVYNSIYISHHGYIHIYTCTIKNQLNVGQYTKHGCSGYFLLLWTLLKQNRFSSTSAHGSSSEISSRPQGLQSCNDTFGGFLKRNPNHMLDSFFLGRSDHLKISLRKPFIQLMNIGELWWTVYCCKKSKDGDRGLTSNVTIRELLAPINYNYIITWMCFPQGESVLQCVQTGPFNWSYLVLTWPMSTKKTPSFWVPNAEAYFIFQYISQMRTHSMAGQVPVL